MMREDGFSLLEVLVVVSMVGILGVVVFQTAILGLRLTFDIERTVSESIDAQLVAMYFPADVHAAESVQGTTRDCSGPADDVADEEGAWHAGVLLTWNAQKRSAAYVVTAQGKSRGHRSIVRTYCEGGVVVETRTVARFLSTVDESPAGDDVVTFVCRPRRDNCKSLSLTVQGRPDRSDNRWRYEVTAARRVSGVTP